MVPVLAGGIDPPTVAVPARLPGPGVGFGSVPPPLLMLMSILSIQVSSALSVMLFATMSVLALTLLKVGFSALMLCAVTRPFSDPALRRQPGLVLLFGTVLGLMFMSFYQALARVPMGVASTIEFTGPLTLAVIHSRKLSHFLLIALAAVGILFLTPEIGPRLDLVGVGFAALSALCWALFVVLSKRISRTFSSVHGLALGTAFAAVLLAPFAIHDGGLGHATLVGVGGAAVVALLSTVIPLSAEFSALRHMSARTYGILVTLEPAIAALIGALLLGQKLDYRALVAIALVTIAAFGATVLDQRE